MRFRCANMKKLLLISGFMLLAVAVLGSDLKTPAAAAEQKSESHKMIRKNRKHMERPVSLEVDASGEIHGEHRSMGDHANMVELEVDSAGDVRPAGDESAAPISGSAVTEEPSQTAGANDLVKTDSGKTGKVAKKAMTRSKGKKHDFSINEELAGLDDEDAEKLEEKEAVDKVEHLAGLLSEQGMGSKKEEKKLRKEIIEGKKGEEVLSEMEDIMSSIDDDAVDDVVKAGLSPTDKDLLEVERYELDKPDIPDPEEAGRKMEEKIGASELEDKEVIASNDTKTLGIRKWAEVGGKVPIKYCRAGKLTNKAWSKFKDATQHLTKACTKLQFIETNAGCQMKVEGNGGCWSHLGYIGGRNVVNLQDSGGGTCAITGIAIHEILHALGQHHEQVRPDAKNHIKVYFENIQGGKESNFKEYKHESTKQPYDFKSIMHYGCTAFTKTRGKDTIRAHRRRSHNDGHSGRADCTQMGNRGGMTAHDLNQLRTMYGCTGSPAPPPPAPDVRRRRRRARRRRRRWFWR